jgi:hypothetical protein
MDLPGLTLFAETTYTRALRSNDVPPFTPATMKSKERHELQTSELEKFATRVGPFFETYGKYLIYGVCVLLVLGIGVAWWSADRSDKNASAWAQFLNSENAEDYAIVAEDHPATDVAYWARLRSAEQNLREGVRQLFFKRKKGSSDSQLADARKTLEGLLQDSSTPDDVRERATILLAECIESAPDSKKKEQHVAEAQKLYEQFASEFPFSVYADYAKSRAEALKKQRAKDFYAFFDSAKPAREEGETFDPFAPTTPPPSVTLPAIPEELQLPGSDAGGSELKIPEIEPMPKEGSPQDASNDKNDESQAKDGEGTPQSEP